MNNFSDFHTVEDLKFDVKKLREGLKQVLKIKNYEIVYKEEGAIPLFYPQNVKKKNKINIGTAGGMTRLSTGYTFLNIQEHSKYIRMNIENIQNTKQFEIPKKYKVLDEDSLINKTATDLSNGYAIGWFQGRMDFLSLIHI